MFLTVTEIMKNTDGVNIFTVRSSYVSAVLRIVILSVCPFVCPYVLLSHAGSVTKRKNILPIL